MKKSDDLQEGFAPCIHMFEPQLSKKQLSCIIKFVLWILAGLTMAGLGKNVGEFDMADLELMVETFQCLT